MAPSSLDFICRLPPEIKSNIISYLLGKEAAALRLTSSVWRDIACEGLFNCLQEAIPEAKEYGDSICRNILIIRPYTTFRSVADKLSAWPWLGNHIRELEIHLPDKSLKILEELGRTYMAQGGLLSSFHRLREACVNGTEMAELSLDTPSLSKILVGIPNCHTVNVFTEQCPWHADETELTVFWDQYVHDNPEKIFTHEIQNEIAACQQYSDVIMTLCSSKLQLKNLHLEAVPLFAFEALVYPDAPADFRVLLGGLEHFHVGIAHDMVVDGVILDDYPELRMLVACFFQWMGQMENLLSLTMAWKDRDERLWPADEIYLLNWKTLQAQLNRLTWHRLNTLRMENFRAPMKFLEQFILKHSGTLQNLDLRGCFLQYEYRDMGFTSWGPDVPEDNCREMLTELRSMPVLEDIKLYFHICEAEYNYDLVWERQPFGKMHEDQVLLNEFVLGEGDWPMLEDNPDLLYDEWYKTFWTKRGREWEPYEEETDTTDTDSTDERLPRPRPRRRFF